MCHIGFGWFTMSPFICYLDLKCETIKITQNLCWATVWCYKFVSDNDKLSSYPPPPPFWTFVVMAAPPTAPTVVSGRYVSYVCLLPRFGSFLQFVACDWVTFASGRSNSGIRLRVRVKNPRTLVQREFYFTDIWYDTSRTYSTVSIKYFSQATVPLCNIQIWKRDTLTINIQYL